MPEKVPAQSANTPNAQTQAHAHAHVNTKKIGAVLGKNSVPIFFLLLSIGGIIAAGLDINYLINELLGRLGRNS